MQCEKTGFHGFVHAFQVFIWGDAYQIPNTACRVFRICAISPEPIRDRDTVDFVIYNVNQWFDKDKTSMEQNSTLVSNHTLAYYHNPLTLPDLIDNHKPF